jgi:hypothetical protein
VKPEGGVAHEIFRDHDGEAEIRAGFLHLGAEIGLGERTLGVIGVGQRRDHAKALLRAEGVDQLGGSGMGTRIDDSDGNAIGAGVGPVDPEDLTEEVDHRKGDRKGERDRGFIAAEVEEILPDEGEDGGHGGADVELRGTRVGMGYSRSVRPVRWRKSASSVGRWLAKRRAGRSCDSAMV